MGSEVSFRQNVTSTPKLPITNTQKIQSNSAQFNCITVDAGTSIEEEIKERIAAGNRAFHVHKKLFTSKLISQNAKLQLLIR